MELLGWILIARQLGPSSFAVLSIGFLVARWGGLLADWGAAQRGARDVAARDHDAVAALVRTRLAITLTLVPIYLAGVYVSGHHELWPLVAVIVAGGLIRDWVALGEGHRVAASAPSLVRGLLFLAIAVSLSGRGALALGVGLAYALSALASLAYTPLPAGPPEGTGRPASDIDPRITARRARYAAPWAVVLVLAAQVYTTLDTILLEALRPSGEAGIYFALYRIPLAIATVVGLAVSGLVPPLTADLRSGELALADARRSLARVGLVAGGMVLLLIPLLVAVGPMAFGPAYQSGRTALALVLVATAMATAGAPLGALWLAVGGERQLALLVVGGAVVNVAANVVLIPRFGMSGAGAVTVLSEGIVLFGTWRLTAAPTPQPLVLAGGTA